MEKFVMCCEEKVSDLLKINLFLDHAIKTATDANLKELAMYALTVFGIRLIGLDVHSHEPYGA